MICPLKSEIHFPSASITSEKKSYSMTNYPTQSSPKTIHYDNFPWTESNNESAAGVRWHRPFTLPVRRKVVYSHAISAHRLPLGFSGRFSGRSGKMRWELCPRGIASGNKGCSDGGLALVEKKDIDNYCRYAY